MLIRFVIGLFALAGLFAAYQALKSCGRDIDLPWSVDTAGWIAAVRYEDRGSRAVALLPDGALRETPDYAPGKTDRDVVWRPDGNRVFFVSDRGEGGFNVYRWNPGSDKVEARSLGSRSKFSPSFPPPGAPEANDVALITSGGFVLRFTPVDGATRQVLPPVPKEVAGKEGEGAGGQIETLYSRFGVSFREARWTLDKQHIAAVMRREDGSEILILQDLNTGKPMPIAAGARIDLDVSPTSNRIYYSVLGFLWPDPEQAPASYREGGIVRTPFRHAIFVLDPAKQGADFHRPVVLSQSDETAFHRVAVSPDGSMIAAVIGKYGGAGDVEAEALCVMPAEPGGGQALAKVTEGKVQEPSWAPDSQRLAFVRLRNGKRAIHTIGRDGSDERIVSGDRGDFGWPRFSPQLAGPKR